MTSTRLPHVLYVEDSPGDVALLKSAIEETGNSVTLTVATDGESALNRLRDELEGDPHLHLDLVLVDLNLPRINGFGVLTHIRDFFSEIPAAVLTTSNSEADRVRSMSLGARGFLKKPNTFSGYIILAHRLNEVIRQSSASPFIASWLRVHR